MPVTAILVAVGVLVAAAIVLALLAMRDVHHGTATTEARRHPVAAAGRVLRDALLGVPPLPGSQWTAGVADTFVAPANVERRLARIALARQALSELKPQLKALEWGELNGHAREIVERVEAARDGALSVLDDVIEAREGAGRTLTVVLFGRTKAGKSSLFSALTATAHERIGDGRQNFTTELHSIVIDGLEVIDSPGVNGVDSAELEGVTERAVYAADVLIVQFTENAVNLEDFEALASLGRHDRPVVVTVNVKKADIAMVVERPERVFRADDLDSYIARLRSGMPVEWRDGDVAVYHAHSAASARIAPRRVAPSLWEASRVASVIDAVRATAEGADEYALRAPDEALAEVLADLVDVEEAAVAEVDDLLENARASQKEIIAILQEVVAGRAVAQERIEQHYVEAEGALVDAITSSEANFDDALRDALDSERLRIVLEDQLRTSSEELAEKYEDFRADVELADRLSLNTRRLKDLHAAWEAHDAATQRHAKRRKWRAAARIATSALLTAVTAVQPEAAPLTFALGVGLDKALAEPAAPADDPAARLAEVRDTLAVATQEAKDLYEHAFNAQLLEPAKAALLSPVEATIAQLRLARTQLEGAINIESAVLNEVKHRLSTTPKETTSNG